MYKLLFTYVPYVALVLTILTFVRTCGCRVRTQAVWTMVLLLAFSKFLCFETLGGDTFYPDFPERFIWFWNWLYSGAVILMLISIPACLWKSRRKTWLLPLSAWTLSALGLWNGIKPPMVNAVELDYPNLPAELEGYRIACVSDIHCSCAARRWRTQAVVDIVNALDADLVCLCGDYVDQLPASGAEDIEPLGTLRAKDGVWAITGNHEYYFDYFGWQAFYRRIGIRFLSDECVFPRRTLALGGIVDVAANEHCGLKLPDVGKAFQAATNGEFRVLMQHRPQDAWENRERHGVDLQLSGHTHGGIVPGLWQVVARENAGFLSGVYDLDGGRLVVSRGAGQWAGFPMRFLTPSEIVLVTLRRTAR